MCHLLKKQQKIRECSLFLPHNYLFFELTQINLFSRENKYKNYSANHSEKNILALNSVTKCYFEDAVYL